MGAEQKSASKILQIISRIQFLRDWQTVVLVSWLAIGSGYPQLLVAVPWSLLWSPPSLNPEWNTSPALNMTSPSATIQRKCSAFKELN